MTAKSWGGGYVTDIGYTTQYYPSQSPVLMTLAPLLNFFKAVPVRGEDDFHLCEIGCGAGLTAIVFAAANPGWRVTGLDFNPAHIAEARNMAHAAGVGNVTFLEADLTSFAGTQAACALPDFDAVTMHGVWSWVGSAVQDGIVWLLNEKLRPGGLLHVSYNLATGWKSMTGLQRLVHEAGLRLAQRSDEQAVAGVQVAKALLHADGMEGLKDKFNQEMFETLPGLPPAYLAHEFMNTDWKPVLHADVAARLADAKMQFVGSGKLMTNLTALTISAEQIAVLAKFDDPAMTELFKDICYPQALRNDIFMRGAQHVGAPARDAALGDICLALIRDETKWTFEFDVGHAKAALPEDYYRPVLERLRDGPATVAMLMALPALQGKKHNPGELIAILMGTEQVQVLPNPGASINQSCAALNEILVRAALAAGGNQPINFALPALGGAIALPFVEGILLHQLEIDPDMRDPAQLAAMLAGNRSAEDQATLARQIEAFFSRRLPLLRHLGFTV